MQMPKAFPDYRLDDPKRQAEWRVYQEIAGSETTGLALYEVRASPHSPEVDFLVWVENVACFAIEVKGGPHFVEEGILFRKSPEGPQRVDNPLPKAMDAAFSVRDTISEKLRYKSFVISALLFPDMEEDPKINIWAAASLTYVMFGLDNLVQRLTELDDVTTVRRPPTAQRIQQEAALFLTGTQSEAETAPTPLEAPAALRAQEAPTALHAQHITIHKLVLNICCGSGQPHIIREAPSGDGYDVTDVAGADQT